MSDRAPLRYHGGKWLIADWIVGHFPPHIAYTEPFGGGASVLLHKPESTVETYNDLDDEVVTFFRVLREQPEQLVRALELTPFARSELTAAWEPTSDPVEQARRFYVRSYQGRGMGRAVGETGWRFVRRATRWAPPCQEWGELEHLFGVAERLRRVQIECDDALVVMARYDTPDTLTYIDPPYLPETLNGARTARTYRYGLDAQGHARLAEAAHQLAGYVIVSGYTSPLYAELYAGWQRLERQAQVNVPDTQRAESLWLSPRTVAALGVQPSLFELA